MNQFYVYLHKKPDGTPFYVGKGTGNRAYAFARRSTWHKNIVAKYGRQNIIIEIINCINESQAFDLEKIYIKQLKNDGVMLVNLTEGGEGCAGLKRGAPSEEHRAKNAAAKLGNKIRKGSKHTAESIERMRLAKLGKIQTAEHKKLCSLNRFGKPQSTRGIGLAGVCWVTNVGKWRVQTTLFGITTTHGYFDNLIDAAAFRITLQNSKNMV